MATSPRAADRSVAGVRSIDIGRLVFVPAVCGLLALDILVFAKQLAGVEGGVASVLELLGTAAVVGFYALLLIGYLGRGRAKATTPSYAARAAALIATPLPFLVPIVGEPQRAAWTVAVADMLILAGLFWSNWALRWLGRNFSIIAQARGLATSGPYRYVRHPLYLGELVALLGLVVRFPSMASVAIWVLALCLQVYRTYHEEAVLVSVHPQYAEYRARTTRIVPGIL